MRVTVLMTANPVALGPRPRTPVPASRSAPLLPASRSALFSGRSKSRTRAPVDRAFRQYLRRLRTGRCTLGAAPAAGGLDAVQPYERCPCPRNVVHRSWSDSTARPTPARARVVRRSRFPPQLADPPYPCLDRSPSTVPAAAQRGPDDGTESSMSRRRAGTSRFADAALEIARHPACPARRLW